MNIHRKDEHCSKSISTCTVPACRGAGYGRNTSTSSFSRCISLFSVVVSKRNGLTVSMGILLTISLFSGVQFQHSIFEPSIITAKIKTAFSTDATATNTNTGTNSANVHILKPLLVKNDEKAIEDHFLFPTTTKKKETHHEQIYQQRQLQDQHQQQQSHHNIEQMILQTEKVSLVKISQHSSSTATTPDDADKDEDKDEDEDDDALYSSTDQQLRPELKQIKVTPPDVPEPVSPVFGGPVSKDGKLTRIIESADDIIVVSNNSTSITSNIISTSFLFGGAAAGLRLHRIFYFNSFVNPERNEFMKNWLDSSGVPYRRIEPMTGDRTPCLREANRSSTFPLSYCLDSQRFTSSYRHLLVPHWTWDTSGSVMVLDDDSVTVDFKRLDEFLMNFTEKKWNVLRLDCDIPPANDPYALWYPQINANVSLRAASSSPSSTSGDICVRSNAILWRRKTLSKVREVLTRDAVEKDWGGIESEDLNCMLGRKKSKKFKTICVNMGITKRHDDILLGTTHKNVRDTTGDSTSNTETNEDALQHEGTNTTLHHLPIHQEAAHLREPIRLAWTLTYPGWSLNQMRAEVENINNTTPTTQNYTLNTATHIDQIYYHNLDKNFLRRQHMESWLSQQPIPYQRIPAQIGELTGCVEGKNSTNRCRGISGIVKTLISIIDNQNMTGVSLVLEDDVIPVDDDYWGRMMEAIKYVPDDWDIIRFDCWNSWKFYVRYINGFTVDTKKAKKTKKYTNEGGLCGGAFAMLWRGTTVHKLKRMWAETPIQDADCKIAGTSYVQSYCVNIGLWEHYYIASELSDVSLVKED